MYKVMMEVDGEVYCYGSYVDPYKAHYVAGMVCIERNVTTYVEKEG